MRRGVLIAGALLVALGGSLFAWKAVWLGLPIVPERARHLWGVELQIAARGIGGLGSVRTVLPAPDRGQVVMDEHASSDRLVFAIRNEGDERIGVWSGRFAGTRHVTHGFRVQLPGRRDPLEATGWAGARGEAAEIPAEVRERYLASEALYPWLAGVISDHLAEIELPPVSDPAGRLLTLFAFVSEEVAQAEAATDDALLTLESREGSLVGRIRLLVSLLRAAEIPARMVLGLELRPARPPTRTLWVEAWVQGGWKPAFVDRGMLGILPPDHLILGYDRLEPIRSVGVEALSHRYHAIREELSADAITTMMTPDHPLLSALSLYRLPLATQSALRLLLLLPVGALVTALFRNLIGVPTFGTFMPVLVALALRESSLATGLLMLATLIGVGIASRFGLGRLHLLLVPRLSVLLCLVVLSVTGLALAGRAFDSGDLAWGVLLPIVILTMLIERVTVTLAEEGTRNTLVKSAWSLVVVFTCYPIFASGYLSQLVFGYPELIVVIMGVLVWIGGYMGYRLSELVRFRNLGGAKP